MNGLVDFCEGRLLFYHWIYLYIQTNNCVASLKKKKEARQKMLKVREQKVLADLHWAKKGSIEPKKEEKMPVFRLREIESDSKWTEQASYVLGSKLPLFPYNGGWSSTQ